jgi:hypothetical protein
MHEPSLQAVPGPHWPQLPPQPSSPHVFSPHAGAHWHCPLTQAQLSGPPQGWPSGTTVKAHPVLGSQESAVHGFPSTQATGLPVHHPPEQVSFAVHASESSHAAALGTNWQPAAGAHASSVQTFPSSQVHFPDAMQAPNAQ